MHSEWRIQPSQVPVFGRFFDMKGNAILINLAEIQFVKEFSADTCIIGIKGLNTAEQVNVSAQKVWDFFSGNVASVL